MRPVYKLGHNDLQLPTNINYPQQEIFVTDIKEFTYNEHHVRKISSFP